jgi:TolA-binding protein
MSKKATCNRAWQAEAIDDGRLQGPDRDAFLRHAAGCADCTRELAALSRLRELGAGFETRENTELEHRRLRQSLLRGADDFMVGAERDRTGFPAILGSRSAARWAGAFALAGCALFAALWVARHDDAQDSVPPAVAASEAPRFEIQASEGGQFHVKHAGPQLLLGVVPGTYAAHVQKLTSAQRFLMRLPDGELEVHGTRFLVVVDASSTRSVSVSEGLVALRIQGQHELLLHPGDAWSAPAPAPSSAPASIPAVTPAAARGDVTPVDGASPAPPAHASLTSSSALKAPKLDAGAAFARAMTAYSRGDYAESERLFLAFERDFPRDARTEDSAFLRVTARARRGDAEGAKALARDYLRRFPTGLRRVEAERLSR